MKFIMIFVAAEFTFKRPKPFTDRTVYQKEQILRNLEKNAESKLVCLIHTHKIFHVRVRLSSLRSHCGFGDTKSNPTRFKLQLFVCGFRNNL